MSYETPTIKTVTIEDVLTQLGPAHALMYGGDGEQGGGEQGGGCGGGWRHWWHRH